MLKHADEMTPVQICNRGDGCVPSGPTYGDDCQKFPQVVIRGASRRENQAGRKRKGNGGGGNQSPGTPLFKYRQRPCQSSLSKFTFQIGLAGFAREPKGNI